LFILLTIGELDGFHVFPDHLHLGLLCGVLDHVTVTFLLALDVGLEAGNVNGEVEGDDELLVSGVEVVLEWLGVLLSSFDQFLVGDVEDLSVAAEVDGPERVFLRVWLAFASNSVEGLCEDLNHVLFSHKSRFCNKIINFCWYLRPCFR
jgi:hypothetical protein